MFNTKEQKLLREMIEKKLKEANDELDFAADEIREAGYAEEIEIKMYELIETLESISRKVNA